MVALASHSTRDISSHPHRCSDYFRYFAEKIEAQRSQLNFPQFLQGVSGRARILYQVCALHCLQYKYKTCLISGLRTPIR